MVKRKKKKALRSILKLRTDLDKEFSRYIRLKEMKRGVCSCVTCGKSGHIKDLQNGHFVSRRHLILRWDERNCHTQCVGCNVFKNGNMTEYAEWMMKTYGDDIIKKLNKEKQKTFKLTRIWLETKIKHYRREIKRLEEDNQLI